MNSPLKALTSAFISQPAVEELMQKRTTSIPRRCPTHTFKTGSAPSESAHPSR